MIGRLPMYLQSDFLPPRVALKIGVCARIRKMCASQDKINFVDVFRLVFMAFFSEQRDSRLELYYSFHANRDQIIQTSLEIKPYLFLSINDSTNLFLR